MPQQRANPVISPSEILSFQQELNDIAKLGAESVRVKDCSKTPLAAAEFKFQPPNVHKSPYEPFCIFLDMLNMRGQGSVLHEYGGTRNQETWDGVCW